MLSFKVKDIVNATEGKLLSGNPDAEVNSFCTDSRNLQKGDFFVPICGENFDGHTFISNALKAGAVGYLTSQENNINENEGNIVIKVKDTLNAFQKIAEAHRAKFDIPVIAVTGSAGKTSTKDMIFEVLSKKYKVLKTEGNLNNHIGLPMTLLKLNNEHQAAVVEMGMSGLGEISVLSKIAKPRVAIITNIGLAHIGNLGSRQNILKAKMEIMDGMDSDSLIILNGDDALLYGLKNLLNHKTIFYGFQEGMDVQGCNTKVSEDMCTTFDVKVCNKEYSVLVPVPGIHNILNALAAITVGLRFKVPIEDIISGIKNFKAGKMRMNVVDLDKGIKVINDAYNANPNSMEEALKVIKDFPGPRKIAVLGDMLELGEWTRQAHLDIGKSIVTNGINYLVTYGENSKYIAEGAANMGMSQKKIITCGTIEEVNENLKNIIRENDTILVKGSRGMKMEKIVDFLSGAL